MNISTTLMWSCAIILAAIFWSLDGTIIRPNFYEFPVLNIVFIEHTLWAILLSPFLFYFRNRLKNISIRTLFSIFWVSFFWWLLGTFLITAAYFSAFAGETTLSTVIILQKLQPVFALLLAGILLWERLTKRFYFLAWVSIFSAYMIAYGSLWNDMFSFSFGNNAALYALWAAFAFWSSTVFWKSLVKDLWFRLSVALRFTFTSLLALIALMLFWDFTTFSLFQTFHWQLFALIIFTSWAGALTLYYYGLKNIPASKATIFELAWPLSWIFFDWYFNGNILNSTQILFSWILIVCFFLIIIENKKTLS